MMVAPSQMPANSDSSTCRVVSVSTMATAAGSKLISPYVSPAMPTGADTGRRKEVFVRPTGKYSD